MSRTDARTGQAFRGSQKWLQRFVAEYPEALVPKGLLAFDWKSPVAQARYGEYQDAAFLHALDYARLAPQLAQFWPNGGPVWDGLALSGTSPVLIEAKAHTREFLTTPSKASEPSLARIRTSLAAVKAALGVDERSDWTRCYYQYANRLAHVWWFHQHGIEAHLVMVNFLGCSEMSGPTSKETWHAAEEAADYALGLAKRHALSKFVHHIHPDIRVLKAH